MFLDGLRDTEGQSGSYIFHGVISIFSSGSKWKFKLLGFHTASLMKQSMVCLMWNLSIGPGSAPKEGVSLFELELCCNSCECERNSYYSSVHSFSGIKVICRFDLAIDEIIILHKTRVPWLAGKRYGTGKRWEYLWWIRMLYCSCDDVRWMQIR